MVNRDEFTSVVGLNPLWIALPAFAIFTALNLYYLHAQLRARNRWAVFWSAALEVFGYNMLMLYTHENHLYAYFVYTLPLLASGNRVLSRLFWALSTTYALNLFLFDGFGLGFEGTAHWLRTLPGFDMTIAVAMANVAIFCMILRSKNWWFDRVVTIPPSIESAN
jgi:hypothetical protein